MYGVGYFVDTASMDEVRRQIAQLQTSVTSLSTSGTAPLAVDLSAYATTAAVTAQLADYLTAAAAAATYATKSALDTLSGTVTTVSNSLGSFLTKTDAATTYATKTALDTLSGTVSTLSGAGSGREIRMGYFVCSGTQGEVMTWTQVENATPLVLGDNGYLFNRTTDKLYVIILWSVTFQPGSNGFRQTYAWFGNSPVEYGADKSKIHNVGYTGFYHTNAADGDGGGVGLSSSAAFLLDPSQMLLITWMGAPVVTNAGSKYFPWGANLRSQSPGTLTVLTMTAL